MDHQEDVPRVTTAILKGHTDEVWNIEWSHDGVFLASASKDRSVIIWRMGFNVCLPDQEPSLREHSIEHVLSDHPYPVDNIVWSSDDSLLLTSAEHVIKLWAVKTAVCIRTLDGHSEPVTALVWLPDNSGFISGSLDRKIILWDADGEMRESWPANPLRVTGLAVSPDNSRLVVIGFQTQPPRAATIDSSPTADCQDKDAVVAYLSSNGDENRMNVYDLVTKEMLSTIAFGSYLTSVRVSEDSLYALVNHAPGEICLFDLITGQRLRKFTGVQQTRHVIRSRFGGIHSRFVASGSEDGNVYIWHQDTGSLMQVLNGHGTGSVNSVSWNLHDGRVLASCSDDHTVRIWEVQSPDIGWVLV